jgi:hypothetical protein
MLRRWNNSTLSYHLPLPSYHPDPLELQQQLTTCYQSNSWWSNQRRHFQLEIACERDLGRENENQAVVASFTTDEQGRFRIFLMPRPLHRIQGGQGTRHRHYGPFDVDFGAGQTTKATRGMRHGAAVMLRDSLNRYIVESSRLPSGS